MKNDIFEGVTSLTELNTTGGLNMTKNEKQAVIDDFTDEDRIAGTMAFWNHKVEKSIIGHFDHWEADAFGEHAVIMTPDPVHLPNLTALNSQLKQRNVLEGQKVKVVYLGEKKSEKTGRMYENFDVFVK